MFSERNGDIYLEFALEHLCLKGICPSASSVFRIVHPGSEAFAEQTPLNGGVTTPLIINLVDDEGRLAHHRYS